MSLFGGDAAAAADDDDDDDGLLTGIDTGRGGGGGGRTCAAFGDDDSIGGLDICNCPAIATGPVTAEAADAGMLGPKCLVSFICDVNACRVMKLSLHHTHLKMSLVFSGPRLIHWDCHALCRCPAIDALELKPVLANSLIWSRGLVLLPILSISCKVVADDDVGGDMAAASFAASAVVPPAVPGVRKGLRKGKAPAVAQAAIPSEGSILGAFTGAIGDITTADKSKGDSNLGLKDFLDRFSPSLMAASSSSATFRFLMFECISSPVSGDLRVAANCWCCCDSNCAAWS